MNRAHLYIMVATLAAVSTAVFVLKLVIFGFPVMPEERTDVWRVEVAVSFTATGGPAKVGLFIPQRTGDLAVVDQNFVSPGYGVTSEVRRREGVRAVYSISDASGEQSVYYRAVIQPLRLQDDRSRDAVPPLTAPEYEGARRVAAENIIRSASRQAADAETLTALIVKHLRDPRPGDEADLLLGAQPTHAKLAAVAVDLLRLAGVPARIVNGLLLAPERRDAQFVRWFEYFDQGRWRQAYITEELGAAAGQILLPWWRGEAPFVEATGVRDVHYTIATNRSYELSTKIALRQQRELNKKLVEFSLFGLPLQSQALFRTLVVIPIGILLLVILRNVIGVKTFGTFMPVLIALAFRQTGLAWGVLFFSAIVAIGLAVRFYLERLKLLLVPRLAAVVIVVVLTLAVLTVVSYRLGFDRGLSVGLFPIVILTMTIERMTVVWEERGAGEALQQAAGSVGVGALCYLLMNWRVVEHLFFVFPELLLLVLGLTLLLGRYSGYRLVELGRFKVLAR